MAAVQMRSPPTCRAAVVGDALSECRQVAGELSQVKMAVCAANSVGAASASAHLPPQAVPPAARSKELSRSRRWIADRDAALSEGAQATSVGGDGRRRQGAINTRA
jgi:hypothetical protein